MTMSLRLLSEIVVAAVIGFFLLPWVMPKTWYRALFYGGGKPNRVASALNSVGAWVFSHGVLPSFLVTLETHGRRTGRTHRIPLVEADVSGARYIVSMLGENVDWVRNVRAANGEAVLHHGVAEKVILRDVPVGERAPILKAYLARAPGARAHFDIAWDSPLADFERIAARYPVFRVLPPTSPA